MCLQFFSSRPIPPVSGRTEWGEARALRMHCLLTMASCSGTLTTTGRAETEWSAIRRQSANLSIILIIHRQSCVLLFHAVSLRNCSWYVIQQKPNSYTLNITFSRIWFHSVEWLWISARSFQFLKRKIRTHLWNVIIVKKDWSVSVFSHNEIAVKNVPTLIACTDICVYLWWY